MRRHTLLLLAIFSHALPAQQPSELRPATSTKDVDILNAQNIAGRWHTTYGTLDLNTTGEAVTGTYDIGSIRGVLKGSILSFRYVEAQMKGVGEFTFTKDGQAFEGKWKPDGDDERWRTWNGQRGGSASQLNGLWEFEFGRLRLAVKEKEAVGIYRMGPSTATFSGKFDGGRRIDFEIQENGKSSGRGWLQLSKDRQELLGAWKSEDSKAWLVRPGKRVPRSPQKTWLVVLEINWEADLEESPYVFGNMLREFFKMPQSRHVEFRHRVFHDLDDLQRFTQDIAFLPGRAVLVLSTHGSPKGMEVVGDLIDAQELASCLSGVSNIDVLHLSGCSMMNGEFAKNVQQRLGIWAMDITGYTTLVDWDASALADFTYLSLLLVKGLDTREAVSEAIRASPFLGSEPTASTVFEPLGLKVLSGSNRKDEDLVKTPASP